jgi:hypothetical protein
MPVVKGLPERPKRNDFETSELYIVALEKYIESLENWIDIRAFQDCDDEIETKKAQQPKKPKRTEGWERLPQVRKFHYYVDGRSLCGKYGLLLHEEIQADTGNIEPQKEDCVACFRKLVKRRAEKGVEKIE